MKFKITFLQSVAFLFAISTNSFSQQNIGIGTEEPNKSAILDIQSTNKGLLIPRMSESEKNAIIKPANGLLVFQTSGLEGFYYFNSTEKKWNLLNNFQNSIALDPNDWTNTGNNVVPGNFLGSLNNESLVLKVNNKEIALFNKFNGALEIGQFDLKSNIFIGKGVATNNTGTENVFIGKDAGAGNTSAFKNVFIGANAGLSNSAATATNNLFIGNNAGRQNTNGNKNLFLGSGAGRENIGGNSNIFLGGSSGLNHKQGSFNVMIGSNAGEQNINGASNTFIGDQAGIAATGNRNIFIGRQAGSTESNSDMLYIANSNTSNPLIKGNMASTANWLQVNSRATGYLAIGDFTSTPSGTPGTGGLPLPANIGQANGYRLVVQDGILCEKVKVALRATGSTDWADYVFEPEYKSKMMTLEELENFTLKNKHLPGVPTTSEVQKNGLDIHETSKMFMEKIEELTLYIIEMNKEIKALKEENAKLKK